MTEESARTTTPAVIPGSIGHPAFCHPRSSIKNVKDRPRSGIQGWGGRYLERRGTTPFGSAQGRLQVVPYRLMVSVCRGGPGCPPFLSFLLRGFGPARRGSFVSAKEPKTSGARAWPPQGVPVPRSLWCGLRNSLRSDSPRPHMKWTGPGRSPARRRQDNCKGQRLWILACARMTEKKRKDDGGKRKDDHPCCHARLDRASRVLGGSFVVWKGTGRHTGRPLQDWGACV